MSVIIRLQNLPWSANAMDIRTFFRGLSIPEGGVHIVGGEQGDAFIAFSTDEDARQAMMNDGGRIKEVQVKLLLSSRSEMHKVIEMARQGVSILSLAAQTAAVAGPTAAVLASAPVPAAPAPTPAFTPALNQLLQTKTFPALIPGLGSPTADPPQPAVIEPPAPVISPVRTADDDEDRDKERGRSREDDKKKKDRRRSRSRSRERSSRRDRKRDRSRSRDRRRRSRSRDRRDRRRRDRSGDRSRDGDRRDKKEGLGGLRKDSLLGDGPQSTLGPGAPDNIRPGLLQQANPVTTVPNVPNVPGMPLRPLMNGAQNSMVRPNAPVNGYGDIQAMTRLQEIGSKRDPNAFQGPRTSGFGPGKGPGPGVGPGPGIGPGLGMGPGLGVGSGSGANVFGGVVRGLCVRIRDVPNDAGYGDVRRFFTGYPIENQGVKMINDASGRRTGVVLVRFTDFKSKAAALQRDGWQLRDRKVRVENIEDAEFEAAVDSFLPVRRDEAPPVLLPPRQYTVIKISELPPFVKEHDIIKKLSDYSLLSINMTDDRRSKTRTAYVQFAKAEDAQLAFDKRREYDVFGRKTAVVEPCDDQEYEKAKHGQIEPVTEENTVGDTPRDPRIRSQQEEAPPHPAMNALLNPSLEPSLNPAINPAMNPVMNQNLNPAFQPPMFGPIVPFPAPAWPGSQPNSPDCVLIRGLSSRITDRAIIDFFADADAVPARIHLMLDADGRPSGDCFCEFRSAGEAARAAEKNGAKLEGRSVTVDLVPRNVVEEALEGPRHDDSPVRIPPEVPHFDQGGFEPEQRGGFPPRGFFRGRGGFDGGRGGRGGFRNPRGGFDSRRGGFDYDVEPRPFDGGRGGFKVRGSFERGRVMGRGAPRGGRGGFRGFNNGDFSNREPEQEPPEPDGFGAPGCVVAMENVPFRAGIDEILEFFRDFELSHDDVIRRFNDHGSPTGDARVCFRTPFDAQRAVQTLNKSAIRDRIIYLYIA